MPSPLIGILATAIADQSIHTRRHWSCATDTIAACPKRMTSACMNAVAGIPIASVGRLKTVTERERVQCQKQQTGNFPPLLEFQYRPCQLLGRLVQIQLGKEVHDRHTEYDQCRPAGKDRHEA